MSDDLIGFVADALEDSEASSIRRRLRLDPKLVRRVQAARQQLALLACDAGTCDPPPGLAERTCAAVFREQAPGVLFSPGDVRPAGQSSGTWRATDFLTMATILLVGMSLLFPAIANSRYHARRLACQKNLKVFGESMFQYAREHSRHFPFIPEDGPKGFIGAALSMLFDVQLAPPREALICPEDDWRNPDDLQVLSSSQLVALPYAHLVSFWRRNSSSYGGLRGLQDSDGRLVPVKHRDRSHFPILADAPRGIQPSLNHGPMGANVLMDDGSVDFVFGPMIGADNIFLNDDGRPAPGCHEDDAVLAPGYVRPFEEGSELELELPITLP